MPFDINEISSAISSSNGLLLASNFSCMITAPQWCQGTSDSNGSIIRQIPMLCTTGQLPGIGFQTTDIRPHGYGLFERRPIFANFTTVTLSFYCDGDGNLIKFFQSWAKNINNFNTAQSTDTASNGAKMHDFQYPDWYETTIELTQYRTTGDKVLSWKLNRAYPLTINNMDVSWDAENQLHKLSVEFFFYSWSSDTTTAGGSQATTSQPYNMTRIDPSVSAATTSSSLSIRNNIAELNQSTYAPLVA